MLRLGKMSTGMRSAATVNVLGRFRGYADRRQHGLDSILW
jgi:hypothetical protein